VTVIMTAIMSMTVVVVEENLRAAQQASTLSGFNKRTRADSGVYLVQHCWYEDIIQNDSFAIILVKNCKHM
jgi:hypothetical protein